MPKRDGTGPLGLGSRTGWGMGPCAGGIGWRGGFGRGFGRFWKFGSQVSQKEEKQILEEEARILEGELKAVKDRLNELKGR